MVKEDLLLELLGVSKANIITEQNNAPAQSADVILYDNLEDGIGKRIIW